MHEIIDKKFYLGPKFGILINKKWITIYELLHRVSEDLISKEDVDKRVRGLTKLTKDHAVADLTADFFDFVHSLPEVYIC
jgi:hypothetical protein